MYTINITHDRSHYDTEICFFFILISLLSSIAQANQQQAINSWRGSSVNTLVQQWGKPNQSIQTSSGMSYYFYTVNTNPFPERTTPEFGVNVNRTGSPVQVISRPLSQPSSFYHQCTITVEIKNNKIINVTVDRSYCLIKENKLNIDRRRGV